MISKFDMSSAQWFKKNSTSYKANKKNHLLLLSISEHDESSPTKWFFPVGCSYCHHVVYMQSYRPESLILENCILPR